MRALPPTARIASATRPTETCSPVETITSTSRSFGSSWIWRVSSSRRLVSPDIADTTTATWWPLRCVARQRARDVLHALDRADRGPAVLLDDQHGAGPYTHGTAVLRAHRVPASWCLSTFPSPEKAAEIARIARRGAAGACVNLVPAVRSIYRWQGAVSDDTRDARDHQDDQRARSTRSPIVSSRCTPTRCRRSSRSAHGRPRAVPGVGRRARRRSVSRCRPPHARRRSRAPLSRTCTCVGTSAAAGEHAVQPMSRSRRHCGRVCGRARVRWPPTATAAAAAAAAAVVGHVDGLSPVSHVLLPQTARRRRRHAIAAAPQSGVQVFDFARSADAVAADRADARHRDAGVSSPALPSPQLHATSIDASEHERRHPHHARHPTNRAFEINAKVVRYDAARCHALGSSIIRSLRRTHDCAKRRSIARRSAACSGRTSSGSSSRIASACRRASSRSSVC